MNHKFHSCNAESCFICEGGLADCVVCGGAEASLPTECPGSQMHSAVADQVQSGAFDFVDGRWVHKRALDISQMPPGADWIIGSTNGGLTVYAQVGPLPELFAGTPQEALDAAIARFIASVEADDDLL